MQLPMINPAMEIELIRAVSTQSFYRFVQEFWHLVVPEKPVWNWHVEYLCQKVQEVFDDVHTGKSKKYDLIINLPPGSSKCCCEKQKVYTTNGYKLARAINVGDSLFAYDDGRVVSHKVVATQSFRAPCLEVTSEDGLSLTASSNHPVLTQRGWVALEDLHIGDKMCQLQSLMSGNYHISYDRLTFLVRMMLYEVVQSEGEERTLRTHEHVSGGVPCVFFDLQLADKYTVIALCLTGCDSGDVPEFTMVTEDAAHDWCLFLQTCGLHPKRHGTVVTCSDVNVSQIRETRIALQTSSVSIHNLPVKLDGDEFRFTTVTSIEDVGEQTVFHFQMDSDTYDSQNYIQGGFVVHNSTIFSILFPVWAWVRMPECRFITASFATDLAVGFGLKSKKVMQSDLFQRCFGKFTFVPERQDHYINQARGERMIFTTGQSPTGHHAHFILVDDPVDPMAQDRETAIYNINTWMRRVIRTRTVDAQRTPLILIMQRLTENDPTGDWLYRLHQAEIAGQIVPPVCHISLPASLESGQQVRPAGLRRYYQNGLFDAVRLPRSVLDERKIWMSQADYSAQYDQNPLPTEGLMFKVQHIRVVPSLETLDPIVSQVRYWDKAISTNPNACFTVGVLMGRTSSGRFYIMDMQRGQWGAYDREAVILNTAKADGPKVLVGVEMEPGSGGMESAQYTVRSLAGFHVAIDKAAVSKEARAEPLAIQVEHQNVFMLEGNWNAQLLSEIGSFPRGRLKDSVDATTGAFKLLCQMGQRIAGGL